MSLASFLAALTLLITPASMGAGASVNQLPTTGAEVAGVALLGVILIIVGIVLMRRRGRNRTDDSQ